MGHNGSPRSGDRKEDTFGSFKEKNGNQEISSLARWVVESMHRLAGQDQSWIGERQMKTRRYIAAGIFILAAVGIMNQSSQRPESALTEAAKAGSHAWTGAQERQEGTETSGGSIETEGTRMENGTGISEAEAVIPSLTVSAAEEALLDALYTSMKEEDYIQAARLMNENQDRLTALANDTLDRELYLYSREGADEMPGASEKGSKIPEGAAKGSGLSGETDSPAGKRCLKKLVDAGTEYGLVVSRFNTVFLGSFTEGNPQGRCAAVQAMILEEPYFTYAVGEWENGKMNGEGSCGYQYYETVPQGRFHMTRKTGTFSENLLNGPFTYTAENTEGESLCWSMEAKEGITVLDDTWTYYPSTKEYMKGSDEDEGRAYVLSETRAETAIWSNLITWGQ